MTESQPAAAGSLKRTLTLWDLVFYGVVIIQPVAPMGIYGVVSMKAEGHVVTTILIGMCAMLATAFSYGKMAAAYPSAGSAFTYVGQELHPSLGYATGWSMVMDYLLNPVICTVLCSKLVVATEAGRMLPEAVWVLFFASLFTGLNLRGVKQSARTNELLAIFMGVVVILFLGSALKYLLGASLTGGDLVRPFYDPATFSTGKVLAGTSLAALTYIGFDGISTLSEEVENPRRNILLATVYTCLAIGILSALEVYTAQLVWGNWNGFTSVETAFVEIARKAGGTFLFTIVNATLLVATIGSGMGAQLGAARLLYGMGKSGALPRPFFGAVAPKSGIPRNNVLLVGAFALLGAYLLSYERGAEMLNFGAFIAFMGVNLAAFVRYFVRAGKKTAGNFFIPLIGLFFCFNLWWNLSWASMKWGALWLGIGLIYGAIRTKGFRKELVTFDAPPE